MIEKEIKKYLYGSNPIRNVVGNRIYAGKAGQIVTGAMLIVRNVTSQRFYGLVNEIGTKQSILQIDCYENSATKAYDLSELVRNRLSGYSGAAGDATVYESMIIAERADREKPENKSDRWVFRYSADYQIYHDSVVPTFS